MARDAVLKGQWDATATHVADLRWDTVPCTSSRASRSLTLEDGELLRESETQSAIKKPLVAKTNVPRLEQDYSPFLQILQSPY